MSEKGHFLKGSSAAIGLIKVKEWCEEIQNLGAEYNKNLTNNEISPIKKLKKHQQEEEKLKLKQELQNNVNKAASAADDDDSNTSKLKSEDLLKNIIKEEGI